MSRLRREILRSFLFVAGIDLRIFLVYTYASLWKHMGGRNIMDLLTQAVGIVGMTFGILSYLNKNQRGIMIFQLPNYEMGGMEP